MGSTVSSESNTAATSTSNVACTQKTQLLLRVLGLSASDNDSEGHDISLHNSRGFDHRRLAQHVFEGEAVLVSFHIVTAPRHNGGEQRWVVAFGAAALDTYDLTELSPGEEGRHWSEEIESSFVSIADRITTPEAHTTTETSDDNGEMQAVALAAAITFVRDKIEALGVRNIVIIGHDVESQLATINREFGVDIRARANVLETMELTEIYAGANQLGASYDGDANGLQDVLRTLGLGTGNHLNPGNKSSCIIKASLKLAVAATVASNPPTRDALAVRGADGGSFISPRYTAVSDNEGLASGAAASEDRRSSSGSPRYTPTSSEGGNELPEGGVVLAASDVDAVSMSDANAEGSAANAVGAPATIANQSTAHAVTTHASTGVVPTSNVPITNVPTTNVPTTNVPATIVPTTNVQTTNAPVAPQIIAQQPNAAGHSVAPPTSMEFTCTSQVTLEGDMLNKRNWNYYDYLRLCILFVTEASRYQNISAKYRQVSTYYDMTVDRHREVLNPSSVTTWVELAQIIERGRSRPTNLDAIITMLGKNVRNRQEVSAHFRNRRIRPGSALEADNRAHQLFNARLQEVLDILERARRAV